ncbi:uncharacterized protein LOC100573804 isoform X1 [Acyrthosiphon pisum]|uniref:MULE transposase domain-containing protein n=1 Tax=Acyrthosiphon pisum TaxID=7029 RepID=A0A8R2H4B8_ACYPI|nr:uncharacterized protein LOC100573804 isoform X1 [Acyrthosiphon pisum]|eukprot:XP_016659310.1 PREDICTED: uncharacterized protein LOC100573804 isoform X1 [Acyrthosiphon pisum]
MRQIRKSIFPPTPRNLLHLHQLLEMNENRHFALTFQAQPNLFYQGPLMVNGMLVGLVFCNTSFIQDIAVELQNITVAGCDGTFKTVPKTIDNDCYQLFTFQIVYKNVSYPLVYALLNGKNEGIYTALFERIKDMIPLQYQNLMIITDYEIGQINAIHTVFREITHQGCYFHYCQAILRYARNKSIGVYNLVKINPVAANQLRYLENTCEVEFKQASNNLKIRLERSMHTRDRNTRTIRDFIDDLIEDHSEDRIITFLRRAGHRIDGYITQQIGPYPGNSQFILIAEIHQFLNIYISCILGEPDLLLQNI